MNSHIILVAGAAGSGKDTVAGFVTKHLNAVTIAQADPMKRFAQNAFGFSRDQLWGPSEFRNGIDPRLDNSEDLGVWMGAGDYVTSEGCKSWLRGLLKQGKSEVSLEDAHRALLEWYYECHGKRLKTPRAILQTFGTEYGRTLHEDLWSNVAMTTARRLLVGGVVYHPTSGMIATPNPAPDMVLITDGRFRNEVLNVQSQNGFAVRVVNPAQSSAGAAVEKAGIKGHVSEAELNSMPDHFFNLVIVNDKEKGLDHLESVVKETFYTVFKPYKVE